jgi:hypothetical protein
MAAKLPNEAPAEPWRSFLSDLDILLGQPADLHCIGGFTISQFFGFDRETADLDVLNIAPQPMRALIAEVSGRGSSLHKKHRVFIDQVSVVSFPENYEARLQNAWPIWVNLRLWMPEPHDLALTKLERSNERDIRDVIFLAQAGLIDRRTLIARFENEMEPYLTGPIPTWHRTTLKMWVDACWPA